MARPLELQLDADGLDFSDLPLRGFTTPDPLLFRIVPRPASPRALPRLASP